MRRVLVMEAHPQVLDALSDLVKEEPGLELVGVFGSAHEAISEADRLRPDVVLLDMDEPNVRAQRLAHRFAELLPGALIVRMYAATAPEAECRSPEETHQDILKTSTPEFLRSLTA